MHDLFGLHVRCKNGLLFRRANNFCELSTFVLSHVLQKTARKR